MRIVAFPIFKGALPVLPVFLLLLLFAGSATAQFTVTLTSRTPASGPPGTVLSVVGEGYQGTLAAGSVTLTLTPAGGGTPITVAGQTVQIGPGTQRTVNFVVPTPPAGTTFPTTYEVRLSGTNSGAVPFTSSNALTFTLSAPPSLASITPAAGQQGQTLAVTITGSGTTFVTGITQASFGPGISVGGATAGAFGPVNVINATTAVANLSISVGATTGFRTVSIQGVEDIALVNGFQVLPSSFAVTLTSVTPPAASPGANVAVIGTGYVGTVAAGSVTVTLTPVGGGTTLTATGVSIQNGPGDQKTVNFNVPTPPGGTTLPRDYQLTLSGSNTIGQTFTSTNSLPFRINPPAALVSVTPASSPQNRTLNVTITGSFTNFAAGITQARFGEGISVGGGAPGGFGPVTVVNATTATATLTIAAGATIGPRTVDVQGIESLSLANAFTVTPAPTISVVPTSGQQGQTLAVTISGQGTTFVQGQTSVDFGAGITVSNINVTGPGSLTATLTIAAGATLGARTTTVTTPTETATTDFTVTAAPGTISVVPNTGQQGQTVAVTITGQNTNFVQGQTTVDFGAGITPTNVQVTGPGAITATLTIAPGATVGTRDVIVTTGSQSVTAVNGFTVTAAPGNPTISVAPSTGQQGQTIAVTITGTNTAFVQGQTSVSFGEGITVSNVNVASPTSLTATLGIATTAPVGTRTVVAQTGAQTASLADGFTVTPAPSSPTISIAPASAQQGQTLSVTVTGQNTNFLQGQTTLSLGNGITISNVVVTSPTSFSATVAVASSAPTGARTVLVQTGSESVTLNDGFVITAAPGTPSITVAPSTGQQGQTVAVTVTGQNTNFVQGQTSLSFGEGITVSNLQVANATTATATLTIAPNAAIGARTVVAQTGPETASLAEGFTVTAAPGNPTITVSPTAGQQAQTLTVTITGQNTTFVQGQTVVSFGDGITVSNVVVGSGTSLTATIAIASNATLGTRTVTATTGSQVASLADGFTVTAAPSPTITISPNAGQQGQTISVTVLGQNTTFAQGQTSLNFGSGIAVSNVNVTGPTALTATLTIDPGATVGSRTVSATTGSQVATLPNGFTVNAVGTPTLSVSPSTGTPGQTLAVTVTGSNTAFVQGQTTASFGAGITVSNIAVTSPTQFTATLEIAAGAALGPRTVTATTGAQVVTLPNGFVVVAPGQGTGGPLTCRSNSGVPPLLRGEGHTELTGDIVLICTGGVAGEVRSVNLQVFLNTQITSRRGGSDVSEALLIIDELQNAPGSTPETYRAQRTALESAVVWTGVPIVAPGPGQRILRITNIRANAAGLGVSSTLIPNQVVAFLSASPSQSLAISNPQLTVGYIQRGIEFDLRGCSGETALGTLSFAQCVGRNNSGSTNLLTEGGTGAMQFSLRFREGFQTAFKVRVAPAQIPSVPGAVYNTETGFVQTGLDVADSGTRLVARFRDIPSGVRLFVAVAPSLGSTAGASAQLVATDANGAGGSTGSFFPVPSTTSLSCAGSSGQFAAAELPVVNGSAVAVWEVTAADPSALESFVFGVAAAYSASTATAEPAAGLTAVAGGFAPFYANEAAARASATLPIPRFADQLTSRNAFQIDVCVTNLLFPFVTNRAGFDTGIAISNTSRDHFVNPNARIQAGRCTLHYFGDTGSGGAAPAAQRTNAPIGGGQTLTFVVSSGGNFGISGTPGFQGYMFAQCDFQYAHGFAFVTDGPIGTAQVAEGYVPLVVGGPRTDRGGSNVVESLDH